MQYEENYMHHHRCASQEDLIGIAFGLAFIFIVMFGGALLAIGLHESHQPVDAFHSGAESVIFLNGTSTQACVPVRDGWKCHIQNDI